MKNNIRKIVALGCAATMITTSTIGNSDFIQTEASSVHICSYSLTDKQLDELFIQVTEVERRGEVTEE